MWKKGEPPKVKGRRRIPDPACEQLLDCHHTYDGELSAISFEMFIVNVFYYSIRRAGFQPVFFIPVLFTENGT